jgi:hypothetical protein
LVQEEEKPCPVCGISPSLIRELRFTIASQAEKIRELTEQVKELTAQVEELKRRLSRYENSNTPPSRSAIYKEMREKRKQERRGEEDANGNAQQPSTPGRRNGHKGVTQVFTPTGKPIVHTMERCPNCDSRRLLVTSTERRTVVDVPEPLPYTVKEHVVNVYSCQGCGAEGLIPESARRELPSHALTTTHQEDTSGMNDGTVILGRNLLSTISTLWSVARLPLRKVSYVLESMHGLRLSPATVMHTLQRVSEGLKGFQERVRRAIERSPRANFYETGMPVAGKKAWIWVAATKRFTFVHAAMSRGADVLKECFPGFRGVAIVDGWKSYRCFGLIQRCWAHVLREAEFLSLRARNKKEAEALLLSLRRIFHETKDELREHPPPNGWLHYRMLRRLRALLSTKRYTDPDILKLVSKLMNASRDLFTFTLYPGVEPTNNLAERELKEPIVHRKIRGQLKCEDGMTAFSRMMTAVSTWSLQGLNPFTEFKRYV